MNIPFTKMQGLGNDFVVIDATQTPFSLSPEQIQKMARRRTGIGFDQLLVLEPARDSQADFVYRIFNADGGEVGQCGNGARCMALFIRESGLSDRDEFILKTSESLLTVQLLKEGRVEVDMGQPRSAPKETYDIKIGADTVSFNAVDMGNPHAVIVVDNVDAVVLEPLARELIKHPLFPEGVNVSVIQVIDNQHICQRVFERGVGETQACGSAACAGVIAGWQRGLLAEKVQVVQPGGELEVVWQGLDNAVKMIGPAEFVYRGEWCV